MDNYLSNKFKNLSFWMICLVVLIHADDRTINFVNTSESLSEKSFIYYLLESIVNGYTRIAVPLFFAISGYLFFLTYVHRKDIIISKYKKRFWSLVIPYFLWSTYAIVLYFTMQSLPFFSKFFTHDKIVDYPFSRLLYVWAIDPIPVQFWFLRSLIVIVVLAPLIYYCIRKFPYIVIFGTFVVWITNLADIAYATEGILFFEGLFFYCLGAYFSIHKENVDIKIKKKFVIILFIVWNILVWFKVLAPMDSDYVVAFIHRVSIIFGFVSVWFGYDYTKKLNKKAYYVTNYTFFIYTFHEPILTIIKKGCMYLVPKCEIYFLLEYILSSVAIILLSIAVAMFLEKYFNRFYQLINGGRDK